MVENKVGFIIQARLNSSRLPGKILLPLPYGSDFCLLDQIISRIKTDKPDQQIIIATSTNPENEILAEVATRNDIILFRGSEDDVLLRFYEAATHYRVNTIVRLTADNPFIDAEIIDQALQAHVAGNYHYTSTAGLPLGTNIEIISYLAIAQAAEAAILPEHREHVTPFIKANKNIFKQNIITYKDATLGSETWRLTIDNENDYALACILYYLLYPANPRFGLREIAALIQQQPWLMFINRHNVQKKIFSNLADELKAGVQLLKQHDMLQAARLLEENIID